MFNLIVFLRFRFGRRKPILAALLISGITGTAQAVVTTFIWFLILRFLCSAAVGGSMLTAFVLLVEISGKHTYINTKFFLPFPQIKLHKIY